MKKKGYNMNNEKNLWKLIGTREITSKKTGKRYQKAIFYNEYYLDTITYFAEYTNDNSDKLNDLNRTEVGAMATLFFDRAGKIVDFEIL